MIKVVCAIKDDVAGIFIDPVLSSLNEGTMQRDIASVVNTETSFLGKNPEDYSLYSIGTFDDVTGVLTPDLHFIVNLTDLKKAGE